MSTIHAASNPTVAPTRAAEYGDAILSKAMRRLIPFIFVCYVVSYLDRINVGFAALTMNRDLGLTATQFGWGAGLFFLGYFSFEIPSNLLMQRFGARIWIARIMITWGLISMATAFVVGPKSFALARFMLGLAEAGFTPGIYLYFTSWFPGESRAKATAAFLVGIPVANIIGSPISGAIMQMDGLWGLKSWQALLVLEAVPAVLLGIACLFLLSDRPSKASWLRQDEKDWLEGQLAAEQKTMSARHGSTLRAAFTNWRVFALAFINFCCIVGSVGIGLWLPQIVKGFGVSSSTVGLIAAVPYAVGAVCMIAWARLARRSVNRMPYVVGALLLAAVALAVSVTLDDPLMKMIAITITVASILSFQATFWAIPSGFLTGRAAAGGLALIVSIGNLGGFAGPFLIGLIRDATHNFTMSLLAVAAILLIGSLVMLALGDPARQTQDRPTAR
jgi:ACS family tartrate transporter-like MFS transporter